MFWICNQNYDTFIKCTSKPNISWLVGKLGNPVIYFFNTFAETTIHTLIFPGYLFNVLYVIFISLIPWSWVPKISHYLNIGYQVFPTGKTYQQIQSRRILFDINDSLARCVVEWNDYWKCFLVLIGILIIKQ